jgi:hypothetical protein
MYRLRKRSGFTRYSAASIATRRATIRATARGSLKGCMAAWGRPLYISLPSRGGAKKGVVLNGDGLGLS